MKITWFAGTTLRMQIGGRIAVFDPEGAPEDVDATELVSGADTVASLTDANLPELDAGSWRPRVARRLIDDTVGDEGITLWRVGPTSVLIDALGEPPAVIAGGADLLTWNRWADGGVLVLCGSAAHIAAQGSAALAIARPKLLALAIEDDADTAFQALRPVLSGAAMVVLEPGMAVEV